MSLTAEGARVARPASGVPGMRTYYRFRITVEGLMLLVVMILVGFAAWHSGTNLLYLIFAILIAFYLMHGALLWVNLYGLSTKETFPETVVVNQPFDVSTELVNGKRYFPSYAVTLTHEMEGTAGKRKRYDLGSVYFSFISRRGTEEGFYSAVVSRRGYHKIARAAICTRYPFGFEERSQAVSLSQQVLALPAVYSVSSVMGNIPFGFGDQESQQKGSGTDIYGLREYAAGEHARNIHWPTSARAQKLIVSEYSRDERRQVVLLLNNGSPKWEAKENPDFENAVTLTASVASHLISAGFEVGLQTAGAYLPVGQGPSQLMLILRHLATLSQVAPQPITPGAARLIHIIYEAGAERDTPAARVIDSRTWRPPDEALMQGEKQL